MSSRATRTISLSSKELDSAIEVLSSASRLLQLTGFQEFSYRALSLSGDVAIVSCIGWMTIFSLRFAVPGNETVSMAMVFCAVVFLLSILSGTVSLALNIPLIRKASRERKRLQQLGLNSLSKSLWKESRRKRWIRRVRAALLIVIGTFATLAVAGLLTLAFLTRVDGTLADPLGDYIFVAAIFIGLFWFLIAAVVFAVRYLHNQRERMALTADATELKRALQSMRQRAGATGVVSVPIEFLEQTARIEAAQIAERRKAAVLQSAVFSTRAYAVAFNRDAAQQRAALDATDRIELEDFVAHLSTNGAKLKPRAEASIASGDNTLRGTTKSKRIRIEYMIDEASRSIRITAVRHRGDGPDIVRESANA
jgi:hypothetical protein